MHAEYRYDIRIMPTYKNELTQILHEHRAVMLYFSSPSCNVCHALKPKLVTAVKAAFPEMQIHTVDVTHDGETAAAYNVFSIPTVLIFLEGKEYVRKSRYMSVDEIIQALTRPYALLTS